MGNRAASVSKADQRIGTGLFMKTSFMDNAILLKPTSEEMTEYQRPCIQI
ncbi:hypothetical protein SynBIOSE41_00797 [Synechococcus sp. BIOS-E4-1]|nr:hypothetical protein SynBIOSE41_00797 [Synechococcus sp. BIOS-E4-1]